MENEGSCVQRIIIIRHAEDEPWDDTAARPYDLPLTENGMEQARNAGMTFVGKVHYFPPPLTLVM